MLASAHASADLTVRKRSRLLSSASRLAAMRRSCSPNFKISAPSAANEGRSTPNSFMSPAGVSQLPAKYPHPDMRSSKASDCSIGPRHLDLGCRPNSREKPLDTRSQDWVSTTTSILMGRVRKQDVRMGKPQGSLEVRPLCPVGIRTKVATVTFISTIGPSNIVVVSQGNTPETKSGAQSHPRARKVLADRYGPGTDRNGNRAPCHSMERYRTSTCSSHAL